MHTPAKATIPFTVRQAEPPDIPQVLDLIRELAAYEKLTEQCVVGEAQLRQHLFGARPSAEAWVAQAAPAHLLGFALFFTNFSTFLGKPGLYLEDLFVRPEARRQGIGRALMLRLARIAVEREYGRFEWSVLDWNAPAIGFYQQLGAKLLPDWRICRLAGDALEHVAALPETTPDT